MSTTNSLLLVSHVPLDASYGASNSAMLLAEDLQEVLGRPPIVLENCSIKEFFFKQRTFKKTYSCPLPFSNNFDGSDDFKLKLKDNIYYFIRNIICTIISCFQITRIIRKHSVQIVHLNSLTLVVLLYILFPIKYLFPIKIFCHIREVSKRHRVTSKLSSVFDGFICIDDTTYKSLLGNYSISSDKCFIVPNPILPPINVTETKKNRECSNINLAIIGQIFPHKGVDVAIGAFNLIEDDRAKLHIIGDVSNNEYARSLQNYTYRNKNIVWRGHLKDFYNRGGYEAIDVVVRGDPDFRVGRTMYEALVSGCMLVIPEPHSSHFIDPILNFFRKNIFTYAWKDELSLSIAMQDSINAKAENQSIDSTSIEIFLTAFRKANLASLRKIFK